MCDVNKDIVTFHRLSGLSEHRVGIVLAKNGMLVPRARKSGRHFPDTIEMIKRNLSAQIEIRELDRSEFTCLGES